MTPLDAAREFGRRHKLDVADVVEWFTERAAIREFDGGMSRHEAEQAALVDCAQKWSER